MATNSLRDTGRLLDAIRGDMVEAARRFFARRPDIPDSRRGSAANLLHYLALRRGDHRALQLQLARVGWMAAASHTPVIWATQVLENLAKDGIPSRAEITDAAMGERAECVMLNNGPHIVDAVRSLNDILTRMQHHQNKKSSRLRSLNVAGRFLDALAAEDQQTGKSAA